MENLSPTAAKALPELPHSAATHTHGDQQRNSTISRHSSHPVHRLSLSKTAHRMSQSKMIPRDSRIINPYHQLPSPQLDSFPDNASQLSNDYTHTSPGNQPICSGNQVPDGENINTITPDVHSKTPDANPDVNPDVNPDASNDAENASDNLNDTASSNNAENNNAGNTSDNLNDTANSNNINTSDTQSGLTSDTLNETLNNTSIPTSTTIPRAVDQFASSRDHIHPDFTYNKHNESIFDDARFFPSLQSEADEVVKFDNENPDLINHATLRALLVQLTSPEVIDYNFICDFFLTYRIFTDSHSVLNLLLTRLIWGLQYINTSDPANNKLGMLVLLRTFVVIRHWILNYFVDDFEHNPYLCDTFIYTLNQISNESQLINESMLFENKIISDLKIHWLSLINEFWNIEINIDAIINGSGVLHYKMPLMSEVSALRKLSKNSTETSIHANPSYRRSAMLSLYDQKAHHKMLILEDTSSMDENPQFSVNNLLLQHQSSRESLNDKLQEFHGKNSLSKIKSKFGKDSESRRSKSRKRSRNLKASSTKNANNKHNHLSLQDSSIALKKTSANKPYKQHSLDQTQASAHSVDNNSNSSDISPTSLSSTASDIDSVENDIGFSTNGHIKLPTSKVQNIVPPTPVKKMDCIIKQSLTGSPKRKSTNPFDNGGDRYSQFDPTDDLHRKTSIKKLVDGWRKTFIHGKTGSTVSSPSGRSHNEFDALINSAMNVMSEEDERKIGGRVDILSARIIDELEYLIRYYLQNDTSPEGRDKDANEGIDNDSLRPISFNYIDLKSNEPEAAQEPNLHRSSNVSNDEFVDVDINIEDGAEREQGDGASSRGSPSIAEFGSPTKKCKIRDPTDAILGPDEDLTLNRLSPMSQFSARRKTHCDKTSLKDTADNIAKDEDEMSINDLSDLNIIKIDNLINHENSPGHKSDTQSQAYSLTPDTQSQQETSEDSFQRPMSLNWNDDASFNATAAQTTNDGDGDTSRNLSSFDMMQVGQSDSQWQEQRRQNSAKRLVKASTQYFDVSSELASDSPIDRQAAHDDYSPSNKSDQSFSSVSTPSNITQYNAEVADLGIAVSPQSMKNQQKPIRISFQDHFNSGQTVQRMSSRNSGTSSAMKRDSGKSYISYDSAISFSNNSGGANNKAIEEDYDNGLKRKVGYNNLRGGEVIAGNVHHHDGKHNSTISGPHETSSLDLPVKVKSASLTSIVSRSSSLKRSVRVSTLGALTELPFTQMSESNLSIKRNSILPQKSNKSGDLGDSSIFSVVLKSQVNSIRDRSSMQNGAIKLDRDSIISSNERVSGDHHKTPSMNSSTNSVAIPGISNYVLKELAAIPDESFRSNNPIEFALYKLEGKRSQESADSRQKLRKSIASHREVAVEQFRKSGEGLESSDVTSQLIPSQELANAESTDIAAQAEEKSVDNTNGILDEIENANTEDAISYSTDLGNVTQEQPLTPVRPRTTQFSKSRRATTLFLTPKRRETMMELAGGKNSDSSSGRNSVHPQNALDDTESLFYFSNNNSNKQARSSIFESGSRSSFVLPTPKVILDGYHISSDLLSVANVMSNESHISFILSYDSRSLAHHFTIIEKDMLQEIDWKELIELKWNKELTPVNSWLEIIVNEAYYNENKGVNLVISRFNLMVNWIISEILLTRTQKERINIISRFIHIAQNCYALQNFSTLMQIILALTSEKITKLKDTWKSLAPGDILMLKNMEELASPLKNFLQIRLAINHMKPSKGCIPFVGLYLSDLIFNAERPKYIKRKAKTFTDRVVAEDGDSIFASPPQAPLMKGDDLASLDGGSTISSISDATVLSSTAGFSNDDTGDLAENEQMINFSRFRTSVHIVKSLSQCIEWSTYYKLPVNNELLSKCLYIKSLDEEEMNYCIKKIISE